MSFQVMIENRAKAQKQLRKKITISLKHEYKYLKCIWSTWAVSNKFQYNFYSMVHSIH